MPVHNKHHNTAPAGAIYIGRGSKWGNPFVIGKHGTREQVIKMYEADLKFKCEHGQVTPEDLAALHEKDLVCFCAPQACHGDVLLKYAKDAHDFLESESEGWG